MTVRSQRDYLKAQLVEVQSLLETAGNHPVMSAAWKERKEEILKQLQDLPLGEKEARAVLLFDGEPVSGSIGIDVNFVGKVLPPFQSMVMADYADRWHGTVGTRGRRSGEANSRMLLAALPRGSIGLELVRAGSDELLEENQLADTLAHVTRLVEASARSDEDFAAELQDTAPRVIGRLRDFLEAIAKGNAGFRMETGDYRCTIAHDAAEDAYERVAETQTVERSLEKAGVFRGVTLDSWKFDFLTMDDEQFGGKLSEDLSEDEVVAMNRQFFNESCIVDLTETTIIFKNGRARKNYVLKQLRAV